MLSLAVCCVSSGLCEKLMARSEKSNRVFVCVCVCVRARARARARAFPCVSLEPQ
jgi:hypothetical protein